MQSGDGGDRRQATGRLFEDLSKLAGGALGAAGGLKADAEALFRTRAARLIDELDLVRREDFEAARDMAAKARSEQEVMTEALSRLEARVAELEAKLGSQAGSGDVSPQESPEPSVET